jgi:hypothetical protein
VSCENSMGEEQISKGMLKPVSTNLHNETQIICSIAKATLGEKSNINWDKYASSYDEIRDLVEQVIPGFENYNKTVLEPVAFIYQIGYATENIKRSFSGTKCHFLSQIFRKLN